MGQNMVSSRGGGGGLVEGVLSRVACFPVLVGGGVGTGLARWTSPGVLAVVAACLFLPLSLRRVVCRRRSDIVWVRSAH